MKINGIEVEAARVHPAILARVMDETLSCTVFYAEQERRSVWDGPKLIPKKVDKITISKEHGIYFHVHLADGREEVKSLPTKVATALDEQGWLGPENASKPCCKCGTVYWGEEYDETQDNKYLVDGLKAADEICCLCWEKFAIPFSGWREKLK